MKLLFREDQQDIFKDIVEVIKVLSVKDGEDVTDAIVSLFDIAKYVGVEQDLNRVCEAEEADYGKWTDKFCVKNAVDRYISYTKKKYL